MELRLASIDKDIYVAGQLSPDDFAEAVRIGIRSVINNRPDEEMGSQPMESTLRTAAEAAGLFYAYLPVPCEGFDAKAVAHMRALVGELPRPLLAFCRSGARSAKLYEAARGGAVHQQD